MRVLGIRKGVTYDMCALEFTARCIGVLSMMTLLGLIWLHFLSFHEMEAKHDLWLETTVSKIELWREGAHDDTQ